MLLITCFIFGLLGSLTWAGPHGRTVCPLGTLANRDGSQWYCYKFYENRLTFQEAEGMCQEKWRGHLASFKSDKDLKLIGAYVARQNIENEFVWIGLQRDEGSSLYTGWRWIDGSLDTYRKWAFREPNNVSQKDYCVVLYASFGHLDWSDISCSRNFPFLCKWKPA